MSRSRINEVKINRRGKRFQAVANWNGKRLRPSFSTYNEALVWKKDQEARMARGLDIIEPDHLRRHPGSGRPVTWQQLFDYTCATHWDVSGTNGQPMKSADKAKIAGRQVVEALGRNSRFQAADYYQIENALDRLQRERGNSVATTNRRKSALSVMIRYGCRLYPDWRPPELTKKRESRIGRTFRIFARLEDDILGWALTNSNQDFYDFVVLALYLGQRENEILRLRFSGSAAHPLDGYIEDGFAIFPAQEADNKSPLTHAVPLRPIVEEVVQRRRNSAAAHQSRILEGVTKSKLDYWFRTMRDDLIQNEQPDILEQKREGFKVGKDFCIHILRSEFCSRLGDEGFDVQEIMRYSGHSTLSSCKRYVKPQKEAHRIRLARIPDSGLPGGAIPDYSPTRPVLEMGSSAPSPARGKAPQIDAAAAIRFVEALQRAGLMDAVQAVLTKSKADNQ